MLTFLFANTLSLDFGYKDAGIWPPDSCSIRLKRAAPRATIAPCQPL
jgi:LacI family trehalose operon transcriptional repressor